MKALAVGADAVGIAGKFLQVFAQEGEEGLRKFICNFSDELRLMMLLTGAQNVADIRKVPVVITGFIREWCEQRCENYGGGRDMAKNDKPNISIKYEWCKACGNLLQPLS